MLLCLCKGRRATISFLAALLVIEKHYASSTSNSEAGMNASFSMNNREDLPVTEQ